MTLGDYCSATREDGCLVLRIPEDQMLDYFLRTDPEFPLPLDREAFLRRVAAVILQVAAPGHDDGDNTSLEQLVLRAAKQAEGA